MRQTDARAVALRLFLVLGFCWIFRSKELIYNPNWQATKNMRVAMNNMIPNENAPATLPLDGDADN